MNSTERPTHGPAPVRAGETNLERARDSVADRLHDAGEALTDLEARTGRRIGTWERDLRDWDVGSYERRARRAILRRPGRTLLVAGAVGFALGLLTRRG